MTTKKLPFDVRLLRKRAAVATKENWYVEAFPEQGLKWLNFYISNKNRRCFVFDDGADEVCSYNGSFEDPDFESQDVKDVIYIAGLSPRTIKKLISVVKYHTDEFTILENLCDRLTGYDVWTLELMYSHMSVCYADEASDKREYYAGIKFELTKEEFIKNEDKWKDYWEFEWFDNDLWEKDCICLTLDTLHKYEYIIHAHPIKILKLIDLFEKYWDGK